MPRLSQQELETYLWGAANILRGKTAGQDYKTYILTLLFFKRLSDQWAYEADEVIREKEAEFGRTLNEKQRQALRATAHVHRFKIPEGAHWNDVLKVSENIGEVLTAATRSIAKANPELAGVFTVDWNQPAPDGSDKLIRNAVVHALIQHFNSKNLSSANVEPDILGRAYEYLIKMFADDAGAKAGEFFTPPEVVDILIRWLRRLARADIHTALDRRAPEMKLRFGRVYIMSQRTRWGGCSSRRNLSFNWRLVMAPPDVLDYLVVHELAHLAEPKHSIRFWLVVRSFCPDFERHKNWLRENEWRLKIPAL